MENEKYAPADAAMVPQDLHETVAGLFEGTFLLTKCEERTGKTGKPYLVLTLTSRAERIDDVKDWNCAAQSFPINSVVDVKMKKSKFGYELTEAPKANTAFPTSAFVRHSPIPEEKIYARILERLGEFVSKDPHSVAGIAIEIYEENREDLLRWSAAKEMHHNFRGGLLYHLCRMFALADKMIEVYKSVDSELLLTAVALHDIGKLKELDTAENGEAIYSVEGSLLGHALIGIGMIDRAAERRAADPERACAPEKILLLKHCLAAHHGEFEYGAIAKPAILEAFLLHAIDLTDSRVFMYEAEYEKLAPGEKTEKKVYGIDTAVYRPETYGK